MKEIMQRTMNAVILGLVLLATQTAFAYYNPSTGRFLSRDPIGEPGFQVLQAVQGTPLVGPMPVVQQSAKWINRDPKGDANPYHFVYNNPNTYIDPLGLDVVYLLDPNAVAGAGHAALLVGNDTNGWQYFSFGPGKCCMNPYGGNNADNLDAKSFKSLSAAQSNPTLNRYKNYIQWNTDHTADKAAINAVKPYFDKGYNLFSRNCDDVAVVGIKGAGVSIKDDWKPVNTYKDNKDKGNASGDFHPAPAP